MNPLVSEMISTRAGQDVELRFLEDLLNDDCKCESAHKYTPYCDRKASYRITDCTRDYNSCKSGVDDPITGTRVRRAIHQCVNCGRLAKDCWEIRPI